MNHQKDESGNDGNDRYDDRYDHEIDILLFRSHILMPQGFRGDARKLCCSQVAQGSARGGSVFFSRLEYGSW